MTKIKGRQYRVRALDVILHNEDPQSSWVVFDFILYYFHSITSTIPVRVFRMSVPYPRHDVRKIIEGITKKSKWMQKGKMLMSSDGKFYFLFVNVGRNNNSIEEMYENERKHQSYYPVRNDPAAGRR